MNVNEIRNEIAKLKKESNLEIKDIADLTQVSTSTISRFLNDNQRPKKTTMQKIIKILDLNERQIEEKIYKEKRIEKEESFDIEIKSVKIKDCGKYLLVRKNGKDVKITF